MTTDDKQPREWPWNEFPEDGSTWRCCIEKFEQVKRECDSFRAECAALRGTLEKVRQGLPWPAEIEGLAEADRIRDERKK